MGYFSKQDSIWNRYKDWLNLLKERGGKPDRYINKVSTFIERLTEEVKKEIESPVFSKGEPDGLSEIKRVRPRGPRRLTDKIDFTLLEDKIKGAWTGRCAGFTLGIPVEGMTKQSIKNVCKNSGIKYPISDYWTIDPKNFLSPEYLHYNRTPRKKFLKENLKHVGADDDLAYTLLGLLILEEFGEEFTTADVGKTWLKYLPMACTAEDIALRNLKKGVSPLKAGSLNNPFQDWIGAAIRSDPWGYAAAGWPEKAAEFAYRDAYLTHRADGLYGAMFFSAAIASAFAVKNPVEAIEIGLTEIPHNCRMAKTVRQTLKWCDRDNDWEKTVDRILSHFKDMSGVHTLNNAALTVAGLFYGRNHFGRTICLTVMGGLDTDCTGATAGSISGAILGVKKIQEKWKKPLGNKVETYLKGKPIFYSDMIVKRFLKITEKIIKDG
jgi:ADP-ribosylglycohydrolase